MSPVFSINFRREAYLKEVAKARRRVMMVGVWVAYFGVMAVTMGLYGLNCVSLTQRVGRIEQQTARIAASQTSREHWQVPAAELTRIEQYVTNPRRWHDRLLRVSALLPANARITQLAVNPNNLSGASNEDRLLVTGQFRPQRGEDRMAGVMQFVNALRSDSVFSATYRNVKLNSSRMLTAGQPVTEFVIECQ